MNEKGRVRIAVLTSTQFSKSYLLFSQEEIPHVRGQGRWPREAPPHLRSGAEAKRSSSTSQVRSSSFTPGAAMKRDPTSKVNKKTSKTVTLREGIRGQTD